MAKTKSARPVRESITFSFVSPTGGEMKGRCICSVAVNNAEEESFDVHPCMTVAALRPLLVNVIRSEEAIVMIDALATLKE